MCHRHREGRGLAAGHVAVPVSERTVVGIPGAQIGPTARIPRGPAAPTTCRSPDRRVRGTPLHRTGRNDPVPVDAAFQAGSGGTADSPASGPPVVQWRTGAFPRLTAPLGFIEGSMFIHCARTRPAFRGLRAPASLCVVRRTRKRLMGELLPAVIRSASLIEARSGASRSRGGTSR